MGGGHGGRWRRKAGAGPDPRQDCTGLLWWPEFPAERVEARLIPGRRQRLSGETKTMIDTSDQEIRRRVAEVKARLLKCKRCGGWVYLESDPFLTGSWAICVNCGWEEELVSGDILSPAVISKLPPHDPPRKPGSRTGYHRRQVAR